MSTLLYESDSMVLASVGATSKLTTAEYTYWDEWWGENRTILTGCATGFTLSLFGSLGGGPQLGALYDENHEFVRQVPLNIITINTVTSGSIEQLFEDGDACNIPLRIEAHGVYRRYFDASYTGEGHKNWGAITPYAGMFSGNIHDVVANITLKYFINNTLAHSETLTGERTLNSIQLNMGGSCAWAGMMQKNEYAYDNVWRRETQGGSNPQYPIPPLRNIPFTFGGSISSFNNLVCSESVAFSAEYETDSYSGSVGGGSMEMTMQQLDYEGENWGASMQMVEKGGAGGSFAFHLYDMDKNPLSGSIKETDPAILEEYYNSNCAANSSPGIYRNISRDTNPAHRVAVGQSAKGEYTNYASINYRGYMYYDHVNDKVCNLNNGYYHLSEASIEANDIPQHPPWEPETNNDAQGWYNPPKSGDPYSDDVIYVRGNSAYFGWDGLTVQLHGDSTALDFSNLTSKWVCHNCTKSGGLIVSTSNADAYIDFPKADLFPENIRANGYKYANVRWTTSSTTPVTVVFYIGTKGWNLTSSGTGWNDSKIDLTKPDLGGFVGTLAQIQSIAPYEKPLAENTTINPPRSDIDLFTEYPNQLGVGRFHSMKITLPKTDTTFEFDTVTLKRGEGVAKIIIYPHKSGWNDKDVITEVVNQYGGDGINGLTYNAYIEGDEEHEIGETAVYRRFAIQKGVIVVDGMIAFEFHAAKLEEDYRTANDYPYDEASPHWHYTPKHIKNSNGNILAFGFPANDYISPTKFGSGLIDVVVNSSGDHPFFEDFNHINWIRPGVYNLTGSTTLTLDVSFNALSASNELPRQIFSAEQYVHGKIMGRALPNSSVVIERTGKSDITLTADAEGWFISPTIDTKETAIIDDVENIPVRCRYSTFVAGVGKVIAVIKGLLYRKSDGALIFSCHGSTDGSLRCK